MGAVFLDRGAPPDEASVAAALGPIVDLWNAARSRIAAEHPPIDEEWAWSGKAAGWSLRLKRAGRAIVYLTPRDRECRVGFALGEAAVAAAPASGLPPEILELIASAPRYPEGRGVRFALRTPDDVDTVSMLARLKLRA